MGEDKKLRVKKHFGFAGTIMAKGHKKALLRVMKGEWRQQTRIPIPANISVKDCLQEWKTDFVFDMLQGGINAQQAWYVRKSHVSWGRPGFGNALPEDLYSLFNSEFHNCVNRMWVELFTRPIQKTHNHLCIDPGTDRAKNKMSVVSTQFNLDRTGLIDISFLEATNHSTCAAQLKRAHAFASEYGSVDSVHFDSASYLLKMRDDGEIPDGVLPLADVVHRLDGALDKLLSPLLVTLLAKHLKHLFNTNNIKWISRYNIFLDNLRFTTNNYVRSAFPAPSQTRAWMGNYRILVWLWTNLDPLTQYIERAAMSWADTPANEPRSKAWRWVRANLNDDACDQIKMELAWALRKAEPLVSAIIRLQAIKTPVVHIIAPTYRSLMQNFDLNFNSLSDNFTSECLDNDATLIRFYKHSISHSSKSKAKKTIIEGTRLCGEQLLKNFGRIDRKLVDRMRHQPFVFNEDPTLLERVSAEEEGCNKDPEESIANWSLEPWATVAAINGDRPDIRVGDAINDQAMRFYFIAELIDPYAKDLYQHKPSRDAFINFVPWDYSDHEWEQMYQQMCTYIDARMQDIGAADERPDLFRLVDYWQGVYNSIAELRLLASLFLRVLEVPGSSAQAERSISSYNHIVKDKRLRMTPEHIPFYVMLFANGAQRQERSRKRAKQQQQRRRKEFILDDASFSPQAMQ